GIVTSSPTAGAMQGRHPIRHLGILSRRAEPRDAAPKGISMADFDLAVVGGGINGTGIARDAAGRGLRVLLVEQNDLASGTSSASSKLIHGALRYLEHGCLRPAHAS